MNSSAQTLKAKTMADENIPEIGEGEGETPETPIGDGQPKVQPEKTDDKSKDLQSALAQKEHFRSKAEKLEQENIALKSKVVPEVSEEWIAPNDPLEIVRLGKTLQGFDEKETEFIIRNAPSKDIEGIIKASQDEWVKTAIEANRQKVADGNKIPAPSSPSGMESVENIQKTITEGNVVQEVVKKVAELNAKEGRSGGI